MSPRKLILTVVDEPEFSDVERAALRAIARGDYTSAPVAPHSAGEPERLLRTLDVCERLGISRASFYQRGFHRELPAVPGVTDGHPRYAISDVLRLIQRRRAEIEVGPGEVRHAP